MGWPSDILKLAARLFGVKPGPDVTKIGPPHEYPPPLSTAEAFYGRFQCMRCPRNDLQRIRFTEPPCPRSHLPEDLS